MTRLQTYRIILSTTQKYTLDIAAFSADDARNHAAELWSRRQRTAFQPLLEIDDPVVEVDAIASDHLADIANEDQTRWARAALGAFAEVSNITPHDRLRALVTSLVTYAQESGRDLRQLLEPPNPPPGTAPGDDGAGQ